MPKRTVDQSFASEWNKSAAWAQQQGISQNAYLPVYALDQQRLASGYSPMSAAERNRAILAAANPNSVQGTPNDNPHPSNVFNNARSDLASIVTGLEPQHLITGIFDTVKNTVEGVLDPRRLEGANVDTTAANWLQNTLLSFIPGAYDLGAFMRADAHGGAAAGFAALADHPLLSLLDVAPATKVAMAGLAHTAVGEVLAGASAQDVSQLGEHGFTATLAKVLSNRTWALGPGINPAGAAAGLEQLTVGMRVQQWLGDSKLGASAPIQHFVREYMVNNQLKTGTYQSMLAAAHDTFNHLTGEEQQVFQDIFYRQDRGENIQTLLNGPKVTPPVRAAVNAWLKGPVKFLEEKALAEGDVVGVRRPDGSIGIYSATQSEAVLNARDALHSIRRDFVATLSETDSLVRNIDKYDKAQGQLAAGLDDLRKKAAATVAGDKSRFIDNVTEEYLAPGKTKPQINVLGKKHEQVSAVFGPDGIVDKVVQAMKLGKDDTVAALVPIMKERLSRWGYESVEAKDDAAFQAVAKMSVQLDQLVKNRQKMAEAIDKRIVGEHALHKDEVAKIQARQREDKAGLEQRHVNERTALRSERSGAYARARSAYNQRVTDLRTLAQQMEDAAYARGDNAAARADKPTTDRIYRAVKADVYKMRHDKLWPSLKAEKTKLDNDLLKAQVDFAKKDKELTARQAKQVADMKDAHASSKEFTGNLTIEMREYADAVTAFDKALQDNPTDNYRNYRLQVYMDTLLQHLHNDETIRRSLTDKLKKAGHSPDEITEALQTNPSVIRELLSLHIDDVYNNPNTFDAELVDVVMEAKADAEKSALDSVNTMRLQGYNPQWIPQAGTFDNPPSAIKAIVGKGTPHVDVAFARANKLVATRHDVVVGVTKAMADQMKRDAHVDFVEHSIAPRVITGSALREQLLGMVDLPAFDPKIGTIPHAFEVQLEKMGLTKFDPKSRFGFSLPSWGDEALYLPSGLAKALEKVMAAESKGERGIFDKSNQLFRYSILGLSPRYTAHILFGGTFLLALRSSIRLPLYLADAARAMRDGTLPEEIYRQPAQEGFGRFSYALQEHAVKSGKQLAHLQMQEHIERTQGVLLSKASPLHWLKAAADINFRFTRYVTRMQTAAAYLDYASGVDMSGTFIDEVTGERVPMTRERAVEQAMSHVNDVFGDLRSMAPIERQIAKSIMPFYGWTRHIIKYVLTMPADHPWRAMTLALIAYENSAAVPKGLPERIQFLFFLGSPDKQGNVSAIDTRFMDPLRDVANYASLGGWIQALNPVFLAPAALMDPQLVYGSTSLYPNLSYNSLYGIETAGAQGSAVQGLEQFVPQLGAVTPLMQALGQAKNVRELSSNPNAFYKTIFNDLNIPFAQVQKINVKQIAAKDAIARYQVAKQAASNAFSSGDFSLLKGYTSVPNPMNPDYEISVDQLQAVYNQALAEYPGQQPQNVLLPPPTPSGY